ncbi:MAG: alpha/beta fold hydrolase [bacterium]
MASVNGDRAKVHLERFDVPGAGGRVIRGEARVVDGATSSVVLLHGFKGFARFSFFPLLADRLSRAGITAIAFNFSGSGIGEDMERFTDPDAFEQNSFGRELYDLVAVNREAERRGWLGATRGLFGHSRGGGIAILHAARDERVAALTTWSAISTVKRWSETEMSAWRERGYADITNSRTGQIMRVGTNVLDEAVKHGSGRLDIERAASVVRCPWLIVHGDADESVPVLEGERLHAATHGRAQFLRVPTATHGFNVVHGASAQSAELQLVTERTVSFFAGSLHSAS